MLNTSLYKIVLCKLTWTNGGVFTEVVVISESMCPSLNQSHLTSFKSSQSQSSVFSASFWPVSLFCRWTLEMASAFLKDAVELYFFTLLFSVAVFFSALTSPPTCKPGHLMLDNTVNLHLTVIYKQFSQWDHAALQWLILQLVWLLFFF